MNGSFTRLSSEYIPFYADDIADVDHLLPNGLIDGLILTGANIILLHIDLYLPHAILQHSKIGLAHIPYAHHTARNANVNRLSSVFCP